MDGYPAGVDTEVAAVGSVTSNSAIITWTPTAEARRRQRRHGHRVRWGRANSTSLTLPRSIYFWQAEYSGDPSNGASTSRMGFEIEIVVSAPRCSFQGAQERELRSPRRPRIRVGRWQPLRRLAESP